MRFVNSFLLKPFQRVIPISRRETIFINLTNVIDFLPSFPKKNLLDSKENYEYLVSDKQKRGLQRVADAAKTCNINLGTP